MRCPVLRSRAPSTRCAECFRDGEAEQVSRGVCSREFEGRRLASANEILQRHPVHPLQVVILCQIDGGSSPHSALVVTRVVELDIDVLVVAAFFDFA